jgi:hypothetical protein
MTRVIDTPFKSIALPITTLTHEMEPYVITHSQNDSESDSEYETDSDSDRSELLSSNLGVRYKTLKLTGQDRLDDYTIAQEYERVRNKYFTPEITKHTLSVVLDSDSNSTICHLASFGLILDRVIGFKFVKGFAVHTITQSEINASAPSIDLVIPEIPYLACTKNVARQHLIHRIPVQTTDTCMFENSYTRPDIFFTPIKLMTFTIEHTNITDGHVDFEITTLDRTE